MLKDLVFQHAHDCAHHSVGEHYRDLANDMYYRLRVCDRPPDMWGAYDLAVGAFYCLDNTSSSAC